MHFECLRRKRASAHVPTPMESCLQQLHDCNPMLAIRYQQDTTNLVLAATATAPSPFVRKVFVPCFCKGCMTLNNRCITPRRVLVALCCTAPLITPPTCACYPVLCCCRW